MNIALLHYHLKPGGVTTVLRQQAAAIIDDCRVCILAGEPGETLLPVTPLIIPELGYRRRPCTAEAVAGEVSAAIRRSLPGGCDVLHVHNPTLTKNVSLLKILKALQRRGLRLLMQIHDFAEDGRPQAYTPEEYPQDCHYAVINSRDRRVLQHAGLKPAGLHLLPNMIDPQEAPGSDLAPGSLLLYPVRAIRRKNIGEAILLSLFTAPESFVGITLPPHSPSDWQSYRDWQRFARAHHLRVRFELGHHHRLADLMGAARCLLTTSVSEGFGFSYLAPWLYGKALIGRKLPAVCRDFESSGISLEPLYARLRVPAHWLNRNRFYRKWSGHLRTAAARLGTEMTEGRVRTAFDTFTAEGDLDFGLLDETMQRRIIAKLISHPGLRERLRACNPFLHGIDHSAVASRVAANRRAVLEHYSVAVYRKRLLDIYRTVIQDPVAQRIDKTKVIAAFLHPPAFSLLKWSAYEG